MSTFDQASLVMIPSGYKTSKVYSVKPTDGSGDMSFSRSNDTATRVNSAWLIEKVRTNLVTYSQTLTDASWVGVNIQNVSGGQTDPNGGNTATTFTAFNGFNGIVTKDFATTSGTPYTISIYIKGTASGTINFNRSGVALDPQRNINYTTSWQRFDYSFTADSSTTTIFLGGFFSWDNGEQITFAFAQAETGDIATSYIATTSAAVSVGPVANVPRLDYLNSSCPRLLLEPQRTNLVTYSESFDNAAWVGGNVTVTANNVTSPDGYTNADTFTEDASTAQHGRASDLISFVSGTTYTFSAFAKNAPSGRGFVQLYGYQLGSGTANVFANFNLNTGVVGTATGGTSTITNYGNGWYRCTFTFVCGTTQAERINLVNVTSASATAGQSYAGDITKSIYWWGAQVEAAAYATSYIPTLGAAVTRGAETAIKTSATALIGQTEGTIFLEFQKNAGVDAANIAFSLSDGTSANLIYYNFEGPVIEFIASSSVQAIKSGGINLVAGTNKIAVYYKANDFGIYLNGTSIFTDTSGSVGAMSKFNLGSFFNDAYPVGTPINQAILFKTRLTNAQLAELTTL